MLFFTHLCGFAENDKSGKNGIIRLSQPDLSTFTPLESLQNKNQTLQSQVAELTNNNETLNGKISELETDGEQLKQELNESRRYIMMSAMYSLYMKSFDKTLYTNIVVPSIISLKQSDLYNKNIDKMRMVESVLSDMQTLVDLISEAQSKFKYSIDELLVKPGKELLAKLKSTDCYIRYTKTLPDDWNDTFLGHKMKILEMEFTSPTVDKSKKVFDALKTELQNLLK